MHAPATNVNIGDMLQEMEQCSAKGVEGCDHESDRGSTLTEKLEEMMDEQLLLDHGRVSASGSQSPTGFEEGGPHGDDHQLRCVDPGDPGFQEAVLLAKQHPLYEDFVKTLSDTKDPQFSNTECQSARQDLCFADLVGFSEFLTQKGVDPLDLSRVNFINHKLQNVESIDTANHKDEDGDVIPSGPPPSLVAQDVREIEKCHDGEEATPSTTQGLTKGDACDEPVPPGIHASTDAAANSANSCNCLRPGRLSDEAGTSVQEPQSDQASALALGTSVEPASSGGENPTQHDKPRNLFGGDEPEGVIDSDNLSPSTPPGVKITAGDVASDAGKADSDYESQPVKRRRRTETESKTKDSEGNVGDTNAANTAIPAQTTSTTETEMNETGESTKKIDHPDRDDVGKDGSPSKVSPSEGHVDLGELAWARHHRILNEDDSVDIENLLTNVASMYVRKGKDLLGKDVLSLPTDMKMASLCSGSGAGELVFETVVRQFSEEFLSPLRCSLAFICEKEPWKQQFLINNVVSQSVCVFDDVVSLGSIGECADVDMDLADDADDRKKNKAKKPHYCLQHKKPCDPRTGYMSLSHEFIDRSHDA